MLLIVVQLQCEASEENEQNALVFLFRLYLPLLLVWEERTGEL